MALDNKTLYWIRRISYTGRKLCAARTHVSDKPTFMMLNVSRGCLGDCKGSLCLLIEYCDSVQAVCG